MVCRIFLPILFLTVSCTKDVGKLPGPRFTDKGFLDSINQSSSFYWYKNDSNAVYSGVHGPHGPFKLRFNSVAHAALTDNGKLPQGKLMPSGALVIKELENTSQNATTYYYMYKYQQGWLWGRIKSNGQVEFSIYSNASNCVNCHQQSGNRDLVTAFHFY